MRTRLDDDKTILKNMDRWVVVGPTLFDGPFWTAWKPISLQGPTFKQFNTQEEAFAYALEQASK